MGHKIAVIADIHGNLTALEAVIADAKVHQVDEYWCLGDVVMPGPAVVEIAERLADLNPSVCVRGNWDDLAIDGSRGQGDLSKPSRIYFARLAQYVAEQGGQALVEQLSTWPLQRVVTRGALTFALSHNLPDFNHGQALFPTNDASNFDQLLVDKQVDVALYAHVHHQLLRYGTDERIILNPGSIGEPFNHHQRLQADMRANYLILEVDEIGIAGMDFRHVNYDREVEYQRAVQAGVPYLELYRRLIDTGRVDTHNQPLLAELNAQHHYLEQYQAFQRRLLGEADD